MSQVQQILPVNNNPASSGTGNKANGIVQK